MTSHIMCQADIVEINKLEIISSYLHLLT